MYVFDVNLNFMYKFNVNVLMDVHILGTTSDSAAGSHRRVTLPGMVCVTGIGQC